jgi:hypothetical protein
MYIVQRKTWQIFLAIVAIVCLFGIFFTFKKRRGCPGWGATPGPLDFIYFLIFTTLLLSRSGSPIILFFTFLYVNCTKKNLASFYVWQANICSVDCLPSFQSYLLSIREVPLPPDTSLDANAND